jgi:hypothetical protein
VVFLGYGGMKRNTIDLAIGVIGAVAAYLQYRKTS